MPRVILMRHGATEWTGSRYCGKTDLPLDEAGRRQVRATAAHLRQNHEALAIVASPLRRARETAAIVGEALNRPIVVDPDLREVDFGEVEGIVFGDLQARWPAIAGVLGAGRLAIDWPGGESWSHLQQRTSAAWSRLTGAHSDTLVVTHGFPVRLILDLALGSGPGQPRPFLQPAQLCVLEPGPPWHLGEIWPA
jgi:broad specificity phosphatase PhoE